MSDLISKAASNPAFGQHLDWPKQLGMALDAAKVGILTAPVYASKCPTSISIAGHKDKPCWACTAVGMLLQLQHLCCQTRHVGLSDLAAMILLQS